MKKQRFFNMIEVLLALAISAVGITGILGIIPLGLRANRDAMADTFVTDIANSYFAYLNLEASKAASFEAFVTSGIPFSLVSFSNSVETSDDVTVSTAQNPIDDLPARTIELQDIDRDGVTWAEGEAGTHKYLKITVGKAGENVLPDFEADICGWKSYPNDIPDVDNANADGKRNLIRVYLEVSWPVNVPYAKREKRTFVREYFNTRAVTEEY